MRVAVARPTDARANTAFEGELRCYEHLVDAYDVDIDVIARAGHALDTDRVNVVTCSQTPLEKARHLWRQGRDRIRNADRVVMPEFSALETVLEAREYDVVETSDPTLYPGAQTVTRTCRNRGLPTAARASATKSLAGIVDGPSVQSAIDYATGILFVSPMTHERFVRQGYLSAEDDRVVYTGHPLDTDLFSAHEDADGGGPVEFLSVGVLEARKGFKVLARAFGALDAAGVPFHWRIAGSGELRRWIKEYASEQGFADSVTLLGQVPHESLSSVYASADVFVLHSMETATWEEYFGVVYAEAMCSSLPVVGSDSGAIPWVVRDGTDGILVSEGDVEGVSEACRRLIENPELRLELGRNGRENVLERFDIDQVGRTMLDGWRGAIERS